MPYTAAARFPPVMRSCNSTPRSRMFHVKHRLGQHQSAQSGPSLREICTPGVMKGDTVKWRSVVADERWILREAEVFSHGSQTLVLESRARCVTVPLVSTFQSTTSGAPVTPWPPRIESCSCLRLPPSTPTDVDVKPSRRPAHHECSA